MGTPYNLNGDTYAMKARVQGNFNAILGGTATYTAIKLNAMMIADIQKQTGGSGGNLQIQASYTIPTTTALVEVLVTGNYYNGSAGSHTGINFSVLRGGRVLIVADTNHTAGANQGFIVALSGTTLYVTNKTSMSSTQSGDTFFKVFY